MLKITQGAKLLTVTKGAFKEIYSPCGWVEVSENVAMPSERPAEAFQGVSDSKHTTTTKKAISEAYTPSDKEVLSGMSDDELKQYLSLLGIEPLEQDDRDSIMKAILRKEGDSHE